MILKQLPPNYEKLKEAFDLPEGTIFTWGKIVYNPDDIPIDIPLMRHEEVHMIQQEKFGIKEWWDRYIAEPPFRASQEIPAYQTQFKEAKKIIKDKNIQNAYLIRLAKVLSSEMYGSCLTFNEARDAIKCEKLYDFCVDV